MNLKELIQKKDLSKHEIEVIFRTSNSPDELFDAFRLAIASKIVDSEFYKIMLWNKALSTDEISMYAEKICKEFPDLSYAVYFAVAQIFSSISFYGKHLNKALSYYKKSADARPSTIEPYLCVIRMYNRELDVPAIEEVIETVKSGIEKVQDKSQLCFEFSSLFQRIGNKEKEKAFRKLGEKYQKEGN